MSVCCPPRDDDPKLFLCPFCGGKGEYYGADYENWYSVKCEDCGSEGPFNSGPPSSKQIIAEGWNRRVKEKPDGEG